MKLAARIMLVEIGSQHGANQIIKSAQDAILVGSELTLSMARRIVLRIGNALSPEG